MDGDRIFAAENFSFERTCIIGNSGKLKNQNHGKKIDSYDCVVRLNAAPVSGFEAHVGSKTTFRVVNILLQKGATLPYTDTPANWMSEIRDQNIILIPSKKRTERVAKHMLDTSNIIRWLTPPCKEWIREEVKHDLGEFCSTGFFAVLLFSCISDVVDVYGFGFHQEKLSERHYWETWTDSNDSSHKWNKEKEFMNSWDEKYDYFNII